MWIQVRTMDGRRSARVDSLSKLTSIEELRERLVGEFGAEPERQRLFYRGKQLEDGHSLFDYDVGLNDIIQLIIRPATVHPSSPHSTHKNSTDASQDMDTGENGAHSSGSEDAVENGANGTGNGGMENGSMENGGMENGGVENGSMENGGVENGSIENGGMENGTHGKENGATIEGLYRVGEKVDARDCSMGAWFEAQVVKVTAAKNPPTQQSTAATEVEEEGSSSSSQPEPQLCYHVLFDDYKEDEPTILTATHVRPRARYRYQWSQLSVGQVVMVNYNFDSPKERGFWYDGSITKKVNEGRQLYCKLILGEKVDESSEEVRIKFVDELFRTETKEHSLTNGDTPDDQDEEGVARKKKPDCEHCRDNPRRKCKFCACSVCGGKDQPGSQILCDDCDQAFHIWCLSPPLQQVPEEDEWYCPECKTDAGEVIQAGEKMRLTKKKANMQSKKGTCQRDWGKGMACVGRTKQCTIVPSNHFGPIPGVPVGTLWKFRVQASESGIHRPHVAGIHGRESEGAYSIVLSGGYDDDKDEGEEFTYSGSGGRDLSGNKRTAKQSYDQKLTHMNRALARNCCAAIDDKKGATAKQWKDGKPVRVVRNHKGRKTSDYAPEEGNRYDGIYKVVKYWPEKNASGFIVWKYLLRRDDTSPAPWTSEGKKMRKKLGLVMQYPEGYLESQQKSSSCEDEEEERAVKKRGRKRKSSGDVEGKGGSPAPSKQPRYQLGKEQRGTIKVDTSNKKMWDHLLTTIRTAGFLSRVQDSFCCIVCQELVYQPITTSCGHNICKSCLGRSFKAGVYNCPNCRHPLGKDYSLEPNTHLQEALIQLFPGYEGGRARL